MCGIMAGYFAVLIQILSGFQTQSQYPSSSPTADTEQGFSSPSAMFLSFSVQRFPPGCTQEGSSYTHAQP